MCECVLINAGYPRSKANLIKTFAPPVCLCVRQNKTFKSYISSLNIEFGAVTSMKENKLHTRGIYSLQYSIRCNNYDCEQLIDLRLSFFVDINSLVCSTVICDCVLRNWMKQQTENNNKNINIRN